MTAELTPERAALRDLWLAELWPVCREYRREQHDRDRALAAGPQQRGEAKCG